MPQIFNPYADTVARIVLFAIVIVPLAAIGVAYGVMWSPYITRENITRRQPVPFSHEHHVGGLKLDCRYCHSSVERSPVAAVPPTHTCMTCHSQLFTNAEMLAPIRNSLAEGKPIRWSRVHHLPAYVYFDHSVHLAKGVGCSTCHGRVDKMPLTRQTQPLTMAWCLECHRNPVPHLRPLAQIFNSDWAPPQNQEEQGRKLLEAYNIHTNHLTDCSTCHR
jgi:hypothetical protein